MKEQILSNRYLIQEQLGKRGGRETWLAKDTQTEELVVIKILKFGLDFQWEQLKLFEREAQTLQNINHPAIPKYLDYFEINALEYRGFALVQTYIQAESLGEQLDKGRTFSEAEIKQLAEQILKILIHLHSQNPPIIHRDLKPSNILLANRSGNHVGDVYLIDFGSVQNVAAKQEGTITIVGTYGYMPPEQFGDRCVPASDLYSLGATLINLVTKIEPADLPQQDGRIRFEKLVNLSIQLKTWLQKMIQPSLNKRFTSAQIALDNLDNLDNLSQSESKDLDVVELSDLQKFYLDKSADRLEVVIDLKITDASSTEVIGIIVFFIVTILMFSWFGYANNLSIFPEIFFIFLLPIIVLGSRTITLLKNKIRTIKLIINRNAITLTHEIGFFGYQIVKQNIIPLTMNSVIEKLETIQYSKREIYNGRPTGREFILNKIVIRIIRTDTQPLPFGLGVKKCEIEDLNEAELNWLSRELSDWLQVPIEQR